MAPIQSRMHIPHLEDANADPATAGSTKQTAASLGLGLTITLISLVAFCNWLRLRRHRGLARAGDLVTISPTQSEDDLREAVLAHHRALDESGSTTTRHTDEESIVDPAPPYTVHAEGEMPPSYMGSPPPPSYKSQESIITRPAPAVLPNH